jgi:hypothetical protein
VRYYAIEIGTGRRVGMPGSNVVLSESNSASLAGFESDLSEQRKSSPRYQMTNGPLVGPFFICKG